MAEDMSDEDRKQSHDEGARWSNQIVLATTGAYAVLACARLTIRLNNTRTIRSRPTRTHTH